jgi:NarL family two-component system response regulator LiaR
VSGAKESGRSARRRAVRDIVVYGVCGGLLIAVLKLTEYRFLVVEHSVEIYGGLVAALFAGLVIWLWLTLTSAKRSSGFVSTNPEPLLKKEVVIKEVEGQAADRTQAQGRRLGHPGSGSQAAEPFVVDEARVSEFGITARELEILGLIAAGLSNREIAGQLFVSENTVKTHSSRLFDKLGAKRRTQAVHIGKTARLIP